MTPNTPPSPGQRIRLVKMVDDPNPIPPGSEGTISHIDGIGTLHVDWDLGRRLGVIPGVDSYEILSPEE